MILNLRKLKMNKINKNNKINKKGTFSAIIKILIGIMVFIIVGGAILYILNFLGVL